VGRQHNRHTYRLDLELEHERWTIRLLMGIQKQGEEKMMENKEPQKKQTSRTHQIIAIGVLFAVVAVSVVGGGYFFLRSREPNFVVINWERHWEGSLNSVLVFKMEVYNNGGNGWGTVHCEYKEWRESDNAIWEETKEWQIFLSFRQSKTLEFSFNRHFPETIAYTNHYHVEY